MGRFLFYKNLGLNTFMLSFFEFNLLLETTITQAVKQLNQDQLKRDIIKYVQAIIKNQLRHRGVVLAALNIGAGVMPPQLVQQLSPELFKRIVNWATYRWWQAHGKSVYNISKPHDIKGNYEQVRSELERLFPPGRADDPFAEIVNLTTSIDVALDYIVTNSNQLLSKFNNTDYTIAQLDNESHEWHGALATKKRGRGAPGRTILEVGDYKWVSLDKRYCAQERLAGGHCGNVAGGPDDNILSLRDSKEKVKLTFIVNDKILIEAKASGNERPQTKYHPAIAELLKSEHIDLIRVGTRYLPEKDFHFSDLSPELRNSVLAVNPGIDRYEQGNRNMLRFRVRDFDKNVYSSWLLPMNQQVGSTVYSAYKAMKKIGMTNEIDSIDKARGQSMEPKPQYVIKGVTPREFYDRLKTHAPWIWEDW
jgi:hypothetical protein